MSDYAHLTATVVCGKFELVSVLTEECSAKLLLSFMSEIRKFIQKMSCFFGLSARMSRQ